MHLRALLPLGLLVFLIPATAGSQYLYLDTNGNGVRDANDQLAPSGPTTVDIFFVTDRNRDGTPVACDDEGSLGLTINSYSVVLHAVGGDVTWGPMENRLPFTGTPVCFASYEDTTDASYYHNGWGYMDYFPPGTHRVATLRVEVTSGNPSIFVEPYMPRRTVLLTQFGTQCMGLDFDNTYKLGSEWHDADGLGPMQAEAGGPYQTQAGRPVSVNAGESRTTNGEPFSFHWDFGDGGTGSGAFTTHVYANPGDYVLILTATSGGETDADTTTVHVVEPNAPFARITTSTIPYVGIPLTLDGRTSYDPDGDRIISYDWQFGDRSEAKGPLVSHTYTSAGTYTVVLSVWDGLLGDTDSRTIVVYAVPHPPVAMAGGPYQGIVGRAINFNGTGSSDPDGDPLLYLWSFGDQKTGAGVITGHAYTAPGNYSVRLTVTDGGLSASATTSASVIEGLQARAFGDGPIATVTLGSADPLIVHLESIDGSFEPGAVTPWPLMMRSTGTGTVEEIQSVADATVTPDSDQNGRSELTMTFGPEELALLFGSVDHLQTVNVRISGGFYNGGSFAADLTVLVQPAGALASGPLRISPNPFNPEAVVTFSTSKPGLVRAHLFDVRGRLVRTVLNGESLQPGPHALTLDARGTNGVVLASGVYFFRLTGPDGTTMKRVAIAK